MLCTRTPRSLIFWFGKSALLTGKAMRCILIFLRRLFTAISRAGVDGPLAPDEIELPDPVSFRRLSFNPDGTGLILDSPERAWFEKLYQLLDGADLSRVRECTSCKRLFWARRRDQIACTKRCANRARFSRFYKKARRKAAHSA